MINGALIKERRKSLHISQKELAKGITTQGTVSSLERNSTTLSSDILAKLLDKLSLSLKDVMTGDEKIDNQRILHDADKQLMSYKYSEVLNTLNNVKETGNIEQKNHYIFLKTISETWIHKNYDDAIFGYNQILQEASTKTDIYSLLAMCELGVVYAMKDDPKKSSFYFDQLSPLLTDVNLNDHFFWSLMILDNLSKYYSNIKRYDECLKILREAISIAQRHNTPMFVDSFYFLYGTTLRDQNNKWSKDALSYLLKSWAFADFLGDSLVLKKAEKHLKEQGINLNFSFQDSSKK
ncbi:helix-turn-helix domain-containing protein [Lentilactobacillus diolivorans]|uniref:helix-turn-helix domain-containing protein n=1 Tax=Lentilactobacillus diolivorans TaxID=179838 RepID=UPI0024694590|nr:helix-turn-helix domain-containing protein [Lentilactobacillus diolivorans]MDH5105507.1 helix-turn-helix domain-containing protein [Lentilactobacillus diolivorans]